MFASAVLGLAWYCCWTGKWDVEALRSLRRYVCVCVCVNVFLPFLSVRCELLLFRWGWAATRPAPYVDNHGEHDTGLNRGRPLTLQAQQ